MQLSRSAPYANPNLPIWREAFAASEWVRLHLSTVYTGFGLPRGHGEPVLLVPGFLATDSSLIEMKLWLERLGYRAWVSGLGRNVDCPAAAVRALRDTIDEAYRETRRPVTLVGHSLGGCLARGAAIQCPRRVARVVTLGSPVNGAAVHPLVLAAGEFVHRDCDTSCFAPLQADLPRGVAETSIYSKSDGILDWRTCVRPNARAIEVQGTHCGLIWNPDVYRFLAAVLAEPPAQHWPATELVQQRPTEALPLAA
jgi:pimeloyl-ACP methyl ester carboxylesterase